MGKAGDPPIGRSNILRIKPGMVCALKTFWLNRRAGAPATNRRRKVVGRKRARNNTRLSRGKIMVGWRAILLTSMDLGAVHRETDSRAKPTSRVKEMVEARAETEPWRKNEGSQLPALEVDGSSPHRRAGCRSSHWAVGDGGCCKAELNVRPIE